MPDFNDHASEQEQQDLADALHAQQLRAASAPKLAATGCCRNIRCGEEFAPGDNRLFCGSVCAEQHQRLARN